MIHQIKNIKAKIIFLLKEKEEYRDDDNKLIARIWYDQTINNSGINVTKQITAHDFLIAFREGQYANAESIRRCRQIVQRQNPELQGKSYIPRQKHSKKAKTEIHSV